MFCPTPVEVTIADVRKNSVILKVLGKVEPYEYTSNGKVAWERSRTKLIRSNGSVPLVLATRTGVELESERHAAIKNVNLNNVVGHVKFLHYRIKEEGRGFAVEQTIKLYFTHQTAFDYFMALTDTPESKEAINKNIALFHANFVVSGIWNGDGRYYVTQVFIPTFSLRSGRVIKGGRLITQEKYRAQPILDCIDFDDDVTYVEALHPVNVPYYQELTW